MSVDGADSAKAMAAKCRRLANVVGDDSIRDSLNRLAQEYEQQVRDVQRGAEPQS